MQKFLQRVSLWLVLGVLSASFAKAQVITQSPVITLPTCSGSTDGAIRFVLPVDSSNYFFDWSGGNAQTGLALGLYHQEGLQGAGYSVYILNVNTLVDTTVFVNLPDPPKLLVSAGQDVRVCVGQNINLSGSASTPGTFVWSYKDANGNLRTLSGQTPTLPGTGAAAPNQNGTTSVSLRVTTSAGCFGDDTLQVKVSPVPVAAFAFDKASICVGNTATVTFTGTASADATYTWILISGGGTFTENGLTTITGIGPHPILYTAAGTGTPPLRSVFLRVAEPTTGGGSCQAIRSNTITVQGPPTLTFTGLSKKLCLTAPSATLSASPAGGTFSGDGVTGNVFNPAVAGLGAHVIQYKFVSAAGCADSIQQTTMVYANPIASIAGLAPTYCQGSPVVNLTLAPLGGALSGPGTRGPNLFYSDSAGIGTIKIRYVFVDTNGCLDTANAQTLIKPTPTLTATPDSTGICSGDTTSIVLTSSLPGASFNYAVSVTGSLIGAQGDTLSPIKQVLKGTGTATYVATASLQGCTSQPITAKVTVKAPPTAIATPDTQSVCQGGQATIFFTSALAGVSYQTSVLSITGQANGPTTSSTDTLKGTFTNYGPTEGIIRYVTIPSFAGCAGTALTSVIKVQPDATVNVTQGDTLLCGSDTVRIAVNSPAAGTVFLFTPSLAQGSASGYSAFIGNALAQFVSLNDTSVAVVAYQITPTVGGCPGAPTVVNARLSPKPVVRNLLDTLRVCSGSPFAQPLQSTPVGGSFSWTSFPVTGTVTGGANGAGNPLTGFLLGAGLTGYRITPTLGACLGKKDTLYVQTSQKPVAFASPVSQQICSGDTAKIILTSLEPSTLFWAAVPNASVLGGSTGSGTFIKDTLRNSGSSTQTQLYKVWGVANGCVSDTVLASVKVQIKPILVATPALSTYCSGDSVLFTITAVPPTGATIGWNSVAPPAVSGLQSGTTGQIAFKPVNTDTLAQPINIYVGGQATCQPDSLLIPLTILPSPQLVAIQPQAVCSGDTVRISASSKPAGSSILYAITDSTGIQGLASGSTLPLRQRVYGQGTYRFQFTAQEAGCTSSAIVVGVVNPSPAQPIVTTTVPTSCSFADGKARVSFSSAVSGLTYIWKDSLGHTLLTGVDSITTLEPGHYRIVVQTSSCADSAFFTISKPSDLKVSATTAKANCGLTDGSATASILSGATSATYAWYQQSASGLTLSGTGQTLSGLGAGTYALVAVGGFCTETVAITLADTLRLSTSVLRSAASCGVGGLGLARVSSPSVPTTISWKNAGNVVIANTDTLAAGAGTYSVVFTSGTCVDSASVVIPAGPAATLVATATPASTCTGIDGTLSATFDAAASYNWYRIEDGAHVFIGATASISAATWGRYRVVATLGSCTDSAEAAVGRPSRCGTNCGLKIKVASNPVTCQGGADGQVLAIITTGASGSYQFRLNGTGNWITADSAYQQFANLAAGQYTVVVRDALDTTCSASANQNIGTQITLSLLAQVNNGSCGAVGGSLRVRVAGGATPYSLSLDGGATFFRINNAAADTTLSQLAAGSYPLVVKDATPCQSGAQVVVIAPASRLVVAAQAIHPSCKGQSSGGFVVDTVSGGSGRYLVKVNRAANPQHLLLKNLYGGLHAGNNSVVIVDSLSGCSWDTTFLLLEPVPLVTTVSIIQKPTCGVANGEAKIIGIAGGTGPFQYQLNTQAGQLIRPIGPIGDSVLRNLAADTFRLTVVDAKGCSDSSTFLLVADPVLASVRISPTQFQGCVGQAFVARATPTPALSGVQYQWFLNGAQVPNALADTIALSSLQNGDTLQLHLVSTSAPTCITGLPVLSNKVGAQILQPNSTVVLLSPDTALTCPGTPILFTAKNINHIPVVTFSFYKNGSLAQTGPDSTFAISSPIDGDSVRVVMAAPLWAGCISPSGASAKGYVKLQTTVAAKDSLSASDSAACLGAAIVLTVTSNLKNTPGAQVQWLRNGVPIAGASGFTYTALEPPGPYQYKAVVSFSPSSTCFTGFPDTTNTISVRFRANKEPICQSCRLALRTDSIVGVSCGTVANGYIRLRASGGNKRLAYGLLLKDTVRSFQASNQFKNLAQGRYSFVVSDSANPGCTDTLRNVLVPFRTPLSASIVVTRVSACGNSADGRIEFRSVSGGIGPFRHKIRTTDTLSKQTLYTGLKGGTYTCTVHDDSTKCESLSVVQVDTSLPLKAFAHVLTPLHCYGDSNAVVRIDSVFNGSGGYAYSSLRPDTGFVPFTPGITLIRGFKAGNFTLYVRDGSRCATSVQVLVKQPDSLLVAFGQVQASACNAPTGAITLTADYGGTGPKLYTLLAPGAAKLDTISLPTDKTLRQLKPGPYQLTVFDSLSCSNTFSFTIPTVAPVVDTVLVQGNCPGSSNGVAKAIMIAGGQRPYTFSLSGPDGLSRTQADSVFAQLPAGAYTLSTYDSSGSACTSTYAFTIKPLDSLGARVVQFVPSTCSNWDGKAVLKIVGGVPPYRFAYDSLPGIFSPYLSLTGDTLVLVNLTARPMGSLHQIRLQDSAADGGCVGTFNFQLPGNTPLTYSDSVVSVLCNGDRTGSILLQNLRGTGPIQLNVFDATTGTLVRTDSARDTYFTGSSFTLNKMPAGTFNVEFLNYGVCKSSSTKSITLSEPPRLTPYYRNTVASTPEFAEGEIELDSIGGGKKPYQIRLGADASWQAYNPGIFLPKLPPGNFSLYIADSNGCQVVRKLVVRRDSTFGKTNLFTPNGDGINDRWVFENLETGSSVKVFSRWGRLVYEANSYANDWDADGVLDGVYLYVLTTPTGDQISGWVEVNRTVGR